MPSPRTVQANLLATLSEFKLSSDEKKRKVQKKALMRNKLAFGCLGHALSSDQMLQLLISGHTKEFLQVLAWKVVHELHKQFQPMDVVSKIKMHKMLNVTMKGKKTLEQLGSIENHSCATTDEDEKMAVVMAAAPQDFQMILVTKQWTKGAGFTLDDIENAMSQQWRSIYGKRASQNLGSNEDCNSKLGLTGQLKGTCHNCG